MRRAQAGESARSLAAKFGVAPSALIRLLREQGVSVQKQTVSEELVAELAREYEAGATMAELEAFHGLSHSPVYRALHQAGVEMAARAPRTKNLA